MSKPPSNTIIQPPPPSGKNARLPSSAGGGANPAPTGAKLKWVCDGSKKCNSFHCKNVHVSERVQPKDCWYAANGPDGCSICNSQPSQNCRHFQGCTDPSCQLKHDSRRKIPSDFPSLIGLAGPVESAQDLTVSAAAPATFAKVVAKSAAEPTSSNTSCGVPEIQAAIDQLNMMRKDLELVDQGPIPCWITLLTQLSNVPNLHAFSTHVGQTITTALSFCQAHSDVSMKKYRKLFEQNVQGKRDCLFDRKMFEIEQSESISTNACTALAFTWSLFNGRNQEYLTIFAMSLEPTESLDPEFIVSEFVSCFRFLDESTVSSLKQRLNSMKSIQEFRKFVHEIKRMFKVLENDVLTFLEKEQPNDGGGEEADREPKNSTLSFFLKEIVGIEPDLSSMEQDDMVELYTKFIESLEMFSLFFEKFESYFFDIKANEQFFNMLVRSMTERLTKADAEPLKNGLLSGDQTQEFFTTYILPLFNKTLDRTTRYLQRTDEAVLESIKNFLKMKDGFLNQGLIDFLFSTFETGGNEGRLSIVKAIDNYLNVLMKYFGIIEDPIDVPFGHKWVMKYKNLSGEKVVEDVSHLVGEYIFKLVCVAKVLADDKKDLSIRFGNCGVSSKRGVDKKEKDAGTPVSISFLFDEIGKSMTDERNFGFVKATKEFPEKVPTMFCQKIMKKLPKSSHGQVMGVFMERSIHEIAKTAFDGKSAQATFLQKVEQVMKDFRVNSQNDELLHLFLSIFKRNPTDKFQMSLVEFLLHEPCRTSLLNSLSFVDDRFQMSELTRSTVSDVLRFSTNLPESHDTEVISAVREAFGFIIRSGITLSEVLDICAVFKDLFLANTSSMVFINTFGVALMTAASKTWGLKFETMYAIVTDSLNPTSGIVKTLESFSKSLRSDVSKLFRPSTNFFKICVKPTPNCLSFCCDATSSHVENESSSLEFKKMVSKIFPLVMFSSIHHKAERTGRLTHSSSDVLDRIVMIMIASNRTVILETLGLMEMAPLTEQSVNQTREDIFLRLLAPSLTTSTLSMYFDSLQRYLTGNHEMIQELLEDSEINRLRAEYRMEVQLRSLYQFLMTGGILGQDDMEKFNNPDFHSGVFTTNWRGQQVVDIESLAKVISKNYDVSESFVIGVFSIINRALYPNHKDVRARRAMFNSLYENRMSLLHEQFNERARLVQNSSFLPATSFAKVAFESFDTPPGVKDLFDRFMSLVEKSMAPTIQQRIAELPVTLMSTKFLGALLAGTSMKDVECMTDFANEMLNGSNPSDFSSYFSTVCVYIETVFYDDEENGVNLKEFRKQLNESTELAKSFSSYVEASILDFESKK